MINKLKIVKIFISIFFFCLIFLPSEASACFSNSGCKECEVCVPFFECATIQLDPPGVDCPATIWGSCSGVKRKGRKFICDSHSCVFEKFVYKCDESCNHGAVCDADSDCSDYCSSNTEYYSGSCGTNCTCSYTSDSCGTDFCSSINECKRFDYYCNGDSCGNRYVTDNSCTSLCNDSNVCTTDSCSSGSCVNTNNSNSCNDTEYYCDDQGACDGHKTVYKCDGSGNCDGTNSDDDSVCENLNCGKICNPNCLDKCCTKYCDGSGNCESCTPPPCCDDDSDCSACHTCSGGNCVSQGSQADGNKCVGDCTKCLAGSCVDRLAGVTTECGTCEECDADGGDCTGISAETGKNCTTDCYDCVSGTCTPMSQADDGDCDDNCTRCSYGSCVNRLKCSSTECSSQRRCDAAGGSCRDPDANSTVCTDCYSGTWDSATSDCCGDDGANDDWCNSGDGSCVDGGWYTNHCSDGVQNCDEMGIDIGGNDCGCNLSRSGDFTIDFECVLDGAHYLQNGNLTIATGGSLQMNADSSFEFDSGYKIEIEGEGYILKSETNTEIRKK